MRKSGKVKYNLVSPNSCFILHWWWPFEVAKVASSEYEIPILQTSEIFKNKKS
jgi:hypothetical protein